MVERPPILLKITESLPRKSAVRPVYNSPPMRGKGRGGGRGKEWINTTGKTEEGKSEKNGRDWGKGREKGANVKKQQQ